MINQSFSLSVASAKDVQAVAAPLIPHLAMLQFTPFLVLVIISRPEALHERMAIRRTWGNLTNRHDVKLIFGFGGHFPLAELRNAIKAEAATHTDVVQFDHVTDSYYNTYFLVMQALHWARNTYPYATYYGKATDDVWINFPKIMTLLRRTQLGRDFVLGHFIERGGETYNELYEDFGVEEKVQSRLKFAVGHLWMMPYYTLDKMIGTANLVRPFQASFNTFVADMVITGEFRQFHHIQARHVADYVDLWNIEEDERGCAMINFTVVHGVFSQQKHAFESLRLSCWNRVTFPWICREFLVWSQCITSEFCTDREADPKFHSWLEFIHIVLSRQFFAGILWRIMFRVTKKALKKEESVIRKYGYRWVVVKLRSRWIPEWETFIFFKHGYSCKNEGKYSRTRRTYSSFVERK